MNILTTKFR